MIDHLYQNGMLDTGYQRHSGRWEYPTMRRLNREAFDATATGGDAVRHDHIEISPRPGCVTLLRKVFRAL